MGRVDEAIRKPSYTSSNALSMNIRNPRSESCGLEISWALELTDLRLGYRQISPHMSFRLIGQKATWVEAKLSLIRNETF